jgi:hypothetical protein
VWSLGYRFAAASLLEHNVASEQVALKLELKRSRKRTPRGAATIRRLVYRAADVGNPDGGAAAGQEAAAWW